MSATCHAAVHHTKGLDMALHVYYSNENAHTYLASYLLPYLPPCQPTYPYLPPCQPTFIRTYIHTCMHACMHAYIHTHVHMCICMLVFFPTRQDTPFVHLEGSDLAELLASKGSPKASIGAAIDVIKKAEGHGSCIWTVLEDIM